MLDIVAYLRGYSDQVHQPREDVDFALMAKRDSGLALVVARLQQEHRVIAHAGDVLLKHLNAVLEDAVVSRADVEMAMATYLVYYGNHIAKDEEDILGVAASTLTTQDWEAVRNAVPDRVDPVFGTTPEERFRELRRQIALEAWRQAGCSSKAMRRAVPGRSYNRVSPSRLEARMRSALCIALAALMPFTALAQGKSDSAMGWPAVRAKLEAHWKATYPTEKILRVEQKGPLQFYATERRTEVSESWGWFWETRTIERQGAFARQVALVSVERANKTQARFEVAALFEHLGGAWQFKQVAVGKVEDLSAAKAGDLPTAAQAAAIFTAAWKKHRPDFDVQSIEVLKSEPKQHQDRRWITYKLAIVATGTDKGSREMYQKKYRCTPEDYSSVLKLEGGNWVADDKMIANVNESRDCSLAK